MLLLRCDMDKFRDKFDGMGWLKGQFEYYKEAVQAVHIALFDKLSMFLKKICMYSSSVVV